MLARLAREPLLHFLVLGGLLFVFFGRGGSSPSAAGSDIVLTAADIERIAAGFAKTWQRPPSEDELKGVQSTTIFSRRFFIEPAYRWASTKKTPLSADAYARRWNSS
jgi:hypothetical protein